MFLYRNLISITDFKDHEILKIIKQAIKARRVNKFTPLLKNKTLAMIFEKPSLRTRLSFEVGMTQLGGHAIYLGPSDIEMGKRESVSDVAKVVSSMADIIMARTFEHKTIIELAKYSTVPVINGLSDLEHPCQTLADLMTILEVKKSFKDLTIAYVGDAENNVTHSMCLACAILGIKIRCASPKRYKMNREVVEKSLKIREDNNFEIFETDSPQEAIKNSDVVITDTWVSMGDEKEKEEGLKIFKPYQVNKSLLQLANRDAIFMHCLPAHRDLEVTSDVIDGKQSVVFSEAENRLHIQKSIILFCLGKIK